MILWTLDYAVNSNAMNIGVPCFIDVITTANDISGVVQEVSSKHALNLISKAAASERPILLLSKNDTISHIDISDKGIEHIFLFIGKIEKYGLNLNFICT